MSEPLRDPVFPHPDELPGPSLWRNRPFQRVWAGSGPRYAVSVGLLVDRDGIVRAVHHGGYLSETDPRGRAETRAFRQALEQVLAEQDDRL